MKVGIATGCMDGTSGLHVGHRFFLAQCSKRCDYLILLLNCDEYIRRTKRREPLMKQVDRVKEIRDTDYVDEIIVLYDDSPLDLILQIRPNILFAGSDYNLDQIVGAKNVLSWGGEVFIVPRLEGISTTEIIKNQLSFDI
jgi:D-beta-D-heptose 7-phosphate kinase/D-beta-D-heptose 1-phosphate adenosyltransferase